MQLPAPEAHGFDKLREAVGLSPRGVGRMPRGQTTALVLGLALALVAIPSVSVSEPALVSTQGIADVRQGPPGPLVFRLIGEPVTYLVGNVTEVDYAAIAQALFWSRKTGQTLTVRVDADQGAFPKGGAGPVFVVREIVYRGKVIQGSSPSRLAVPTELTDPSLNPALARALAKGALLSATHDQDGAIRALSVALSDSSLKPSYRGMALIIRGGALAARAEETRSGPSPAADRDLISALADFDAAAALNRPSVESRSNVLKYLGAYDEALAGYETAARQNPDQDFWPLIGAAATYRTRGDYDVALATLDQLAKRHPALKGMAYYYNLGSTLVEARRFDEAVGALTKGIVLQRDYSYAYFMRACALSQLGRLEEAEKDIEMGRRFLVSLSTARGEPPVGEQPPGQDKERWSEQVTAQLQAAVAAGNQAPSDAACHIPGSGWLVRRERSALLPASAGPGQGSPAATPVP